jgi:hypothetical protein
MEGFGRPTRWLLLGMLAAGCAEAPPPARALATSERDARAPIDDASGFSWSSSAPDVKLLDRDEATAIHPRALAAALAPDAAAVVLREPVGEPLAQYTAALPRRMQLDEATIVYDDPSAIDEHEARRFRLEGRRGTLSLRYEGLVVDRLGQRFAVTAWTAGDRDLRPMIDGFTLTKPRAEQTETRSESGPGWRLQGGRFEDVASRLRLEVPTGWRLFVGDELAAAAPGADLALSSGTTTVAIASEPIFEAQGSAEGMTVMVANRRVRLAEHGDGWHGRDCRDGRCLTVAVRGNLSDGRAVLSMIELIPEKEAQELARELVPGATSHVEATRSLRDGVFRDHALGLTYRVPAGFRVIAGREAQRLHEGAALVLDHRASALRAVLFVDDELRKFAGLLPEGAATKRPVTGGEAVVQPANVAAASSIHAASITAGREGAAITMVVWGPRDAPLLTEDLAAGIDLGADARAIVRSGESYEDRRLGFRMNVPASWTIDETPVESLAMIGSLVRWHQGDRWFGVIALSAPETARAGDQIPALLEQVLRDAYGPFARGELSVAEATLAGLPARHLSWRSTLSHFDIAVARRGAFVYAVMAADHEPAAFTAATGGFELVAP